MMIMKTMLSLVLLVWACGSPALKFHSYVNERGETVFSNVPDHCVKDSTLVCLQYHPLISQPGKAEGHSAKTLAGQSPRQRKAATGRNAPGSQGRSNQAAGKTGSGVNFDTLERIVEMNQIIDQYFPGRANADETAGVRAQQQEILQMLKVIRNNASGSEQTSIDRAMDVLRSNLAR